MAVLRGGTAGPPAGDRRLAADLHRINVPATIVNGRADHLVPVGLAENLAAAIPGAPLELIAGANHLLPQRYPDAVADAVRAVAARGGATARDESRLDDEEAAHGESRAEHADHGPHHQQEDAGDDGLVRGHVELPGPEHGLVADE